MYNLLDFQILNFILLIFKSYDVYHVTKKLRNAIIQYNIFKFGISIVCLKRVEYRSVITIPK